MSLLWDDAPAAELRQKPVVTAVAKPVPKKSTALLCMINRFGQPTKKPAECWRWTRLERGFGWWNPEEVPVPKW